MVAVTTRQKGNEMCNYYEDEFYEPSEAEAKMQEITDMLKESVKQEIKSELERLREENAELRQYKEKQRENDAELARALRELKAGKEKLERDVKKARIRELFGDHIVSAWVVQRIYSQKPKCNKCNSERKIEFLSPRGKKCKEDCECSECMVSYVPQKTELIEFKTSDEWSDVKWRCVYYSAPTIWYDGTEIEDSVHRLSNVYAGEPFSDIGESYRATQTVFLDEAKCREFCDYLNNKEKEKNGK